MYDLEKLRREEFPLSAEYIYFNHAGISPLPVRTRNKMQWAVGELAAQPSNHFAQHGMAMFEAFNKDIAAFINAAHAYEIAGISSTSAGINLIAQSLPFQKGDNI